MGAKKKKGKKDEVEIFNSINFFKIKIYMFIFQVDQEAPKPPPPPKRDNW
jgi:hypothetical protein